ncbi:MAG: phage protease [Proteobacteria bacterium]|nr:phage protease [Pseudomonadota bacterium]MBU1741976.1 phage protease [Pseudomonadota bacterium]
MSRHDFAELKDVEIFEAGTYRGRTYTAQDLRQMIANWKDFGDQLKPTLVVGHDENQVLLQNSGLPAAGWLAGLRLRGGRLVADFRDVPQVIVDLVKKGAYRRVSAEVYRNFKRGAQNVGFVLRRVALLGGEIPEIKTLEDVAALYEEPATPGDTEWLACHDAPATPADEPSGEEVAAPAAETKQYAEAEVVARLEAERAQARQEVARAEAEARDAQARCAETEARLVRLSEEETRTRIERLIARLKQGRGHLALAPAMVDGPVSEFLGGLDHEATVRFGEADRPLADAFVQVIEALLEAQGRGAAFVTFGETAPQSPPTPVAPGDVDPGQNVARLAEEYRRTNPGKNFTQAVRDVLAEHPDLARSYHRHR